MEMPLVTPDTRRPSDGRRLDERARRDLAQQNPALGSIPATEEQRKLLKLNFLDQMSLYEAMCRITFKFNQRAIQDLVLEHAKHREAA
jgi:hypothetical protein